MYHRAIAERSASCLITQCLFKTTSSRGDSQVYDNSLIVLRRLHFHSHSHKEKVDFHGHISLLFAKASLTVNTADIKYFHMHVIGLNVSCDRIQGNTVQNSQFSLS